MPGDVGRVDLTNCDREPIHVPGTIQPFGLLIAVSTDWLISRVSHNIDRFTGRAPDALLGKPLQAVFTADAEHALRNLASRLRGTDASPLLLIEPFSARARAIRDAQQARGLDLNGSWKARIKAFPALLIPLVTLALSDLDQRASVLDGRAFRARPFRVVLDAPVDQPYERWLRRLLLLALPVQIGLVLWL